MHESWFAQESPPHSGLSQNENMMAMRSLVLCRRDVEAHRACYGGALFSCIVTKWCQPIKTLQSSLLTKGKTCPVTRLYFPSRSWRISWEQPSSIHSTYVHPSRLAFSPIHAPTISAAVRFVFPSMTFLQGKGTIGAGRSVEEVRARF